MMNETSFVHHLEPLLVLLDLMSNEINIQKSIKCLEVLMLNTQ